MHNGRFVVLTGHLNDYPLSDLVGILRHQRKTGRLLIEYAKGPAVFFFHEGDLVDARINDLTGLQAVCFALGQPTASFNFNPLIQPSQETIEKSLQRTVSELFGCWDDASDEISVGVVDVPLLQATPERPVVSAPVQHALPACQSEPLSLLPAVAPSRRPASLLLMTAVGITALGVSTVLALSGGFGRGNASQRTPTAIEHTKPEVVVDSSEGQRVAKNTYTSVPRARARRGEPGSDPNRSAPLNNKDNSGRIEHRNSEPEPVAKPGSVTVVMEIENGRVLRASIANPKPGMDNYEALALRIARQRRYSSQQNGRETVKIKVSPSDQ
jgi:hypothetical protein